MISVAEAAADERPQYTPGLTRLGRRYVARRHARQHLRTIRAHLATGPTLPRGDALVVEANKQLGKGYSASISCRCSDDCPEQDCSGVVSGARNACAVPFGFAPICMSSFGFGPMCRAAGRLVSEDYAIRTPGCIGIENAWGSSNGPLGTNGHIVIFTGRDINGNPTDDPAKLVTIEEMGTHYGCCHGPAIGRGFNAWAELPDFDYSPLPPPPVEENDMQVFVCPNKPNHPAAHAQFIPAGNAIFPNGALLMRAGASITGDQKTNDANVRLLVPKTHGWVACTEQRDSRGLRVLDDQGDLSPRDALLWT